MLNRRIFELMNCFICEGHWFTCFTLREVVFHHLLFAITIYGHAISYLLLIAHLLSLRPPGTEGDVILFVATFVTVKPEPLNLTCQYIKSTIASA